MATSQRRGSTWTNADGLVVGFGTQRPVIEGSTAKNYAGKGGLKTAAAPFTWRDVNANNSNGAINVPIPAGSKIVEVKLVVDVAFAGASNALIVGDGTDTDGFITTASAGVASLTAGAVIASNGVYAYGATDTGAAELKLYSSADTIDVGSADTDWTAGSAALVVTYI
jgi:hypothetical protein